MISNQNVSMNTFWDQVQFVLELDTQREAELGIGLVRNKEYIGFYLNLTAWNIYTPSNVIQLSLREGLKMIRISMISLEYHFTGSRRTLINYLTLFKQKKCRWECPGWNTFDYNRWFIMCRNNWKIKSGHSELLSSSFDQRIWLTKFFNVLLHIVLHFSNI